MHLETTGDSEIRYTMRHQLGLELLLVELNRTIQTCGRVKTHDACQGAFLHLSDRLCLIGSGVAHRQAQCQNPGLYMQRLHARSVPACTSAARQAFLWAHGGRFTGAQTHVTATASSVQKLIGTDCHGPGTRRRGSASAVAHR